MHPDGGGGGGGGGGGAVRTQTRESESQPRNLHFDKLYKQFFRILQFEVHHVKNRTDGTAKEYPSTPSPHVPGSANVLSDPPAD